MVSFIDHQSPVRGKYGRLSPVLRNATHRDVGHQQMMIHDDDVGFGGNAARLEEKALVVGRAFRALTEIGSAGNLVPDFRARRDGEVAERAISCTCRPGLNCLELRLKTVLEERVPRRARLLQSNETE
jgi:hypothetical protein